MKALKKTLKWVLRIFIVLFVGLLIYGTIFQYIYDKKVYKANKPTGKLTQLSNHKIHYKLLGEGEYTFILETGIGENMETWSQIKDTLATLGRVFMYDRAGLGFSYESEKPKTTKQIAIELNEVLKKENIEGPYILIGHSIGGAHIRFYTHLYPENIKGLFLIDPSHEKMKDDLPPASLMERFDNFAKTKLYWSGMPYYMLPEPPHPTYKTSKSIRNYGREQEAIDASIALFKEANINLSGIPVHIILATSRLKNDPEFKKKNIELMNELIDHSNSPLSKHVMYDKPHHIHVTDPEIVIKEFRVFFNKIKSKQKF